MKFLVLICAIVIVLNCNIITAHYGYRNIYGNDYDEQFHEGYKTGCDRQKTLEINKQMRKVKCMPRDTLVKLVPQLGFNFFPNYALVKRCSGFCSGSKSCMAVGFNTTKIAVKRHGHNSKHCYTVLVEEHTKCKCGCSVKEEDCNMYQQYSDDNCACDCMNRVECDRARHMVWDDKMCKCTCTKDSEEDCSSGLEWVPALCRCAKVMDMLYDVKTYD